MAAASSDVGPDGKSLEVGTAQDFAIVIPDLLLLGNARMACNWDMLESNGVKAVVNLIKYKSTNETPMFADCLVLLHCPIEDRPQTGLSWAEGVAEFVEEQTSKGLCTYIHCSQGVSRASSATIYFLMTRRGMSLKDAFNLVRSVRPVICPSIGFMKGLVEVETQLGRGTSMTLDEYRLQCCQEMFPSLDCQVCIEALEKAKSQLNDAVFTQSVIKEAGTCNIELHGYIATDILLKAHRNLFLQRKGVSIHHPFD